MQLFRSASQWVGVICVSFFVAFEKSLFRTCQLFLFCNLALKILDTALERFHPVGFLIWCGLLFYELSKCICVNAYSALMSLFMTMLLKRLGVHYLHAST